jgi:hypothetical protein
LHQKVIFPGPLAADPREAFLQMNESKQLKIERIDIILQDNQQQIPPAPVGIEKTMV